MSEIRSKVKKETRKLRREHLYKESRRHENTISTCILKISRKLKDYYLSGLAKAKVTCVTILFYLVCVCVCVCIS